MFVRGDDAGAAETQVRVVGEAHARGEVRRVAVDVAGTNDLVEADRHRGGRVHPGAVDRRELDVLTIDGDEAVGVVGRQRARVLGDGAGVRLARVRAQVARLVLREDVDERLVCGAAAGTVLEVADLQVGRPIVQAVAARGKGGG